MANNIKIQQHDNQDCAAACIASIASFYGLKLPLIKIREACGTDKDGTNIKGIIDAAQKIGMSAKAFKSKDKEAENLVHIPRPLILHFQKEDGWLHFVVLYQMNTKIAVILDPSDGRMHKITVEELKKQWSGYIVILTPAADFKKGDLSTNIWGRFYTLVKLNKKELLHALSGSVVYIIIGLSTSLFLQQIIDKVLPKSDKPLLLFFGVIMFTLLVLSLIINYFRSLFIVRASIKIDSRLIIGYIRHLLRLPVSFFSNRSSGELNSRIGDAYRIRSFLSGRLLVIAVSILSLLFSFALLFTYYWKLALLTLVFVPLYIILYKISNKINKKTNKEIIEASAKFQEMNVEAISSVSTLKYFGGSSIFADKLEGYYVDMAQKLYRGGKNSSVFTVSSDAITKILTFAVIIAGSLFVFNAELSIGELVSFYSIAAFFCTPLAALVESSNQITEAQIAAQRLFDIMDLEEEGSAETLEVPLDGEKEISFENVSFSYPGRMELFSSLSFKIPHGKTTYIKGANGSGKSTIASLLMRGFTPRSGAIRFGGTDISLVPLDKWRKFISIVPQRAELFNGTILENITPGETGPDLNLVLEICGKVGLSPLLNSLPRGLLSKTGEQGRSLSGGERQKVAFARALYLNPKVLILDEATASLDASSAGTIFKLLKELKAAGKTIVLISHDGQCIKLADTIIEINSNAHSEAEGCSQNTNCSHND